MLMSSQTNTTASFLSTGIKGKGYLETATQILPSCVTTSLIVRMEIYSCSVPFRLQLSQSSAPGSDPSGASIRQPPHPPSTIHQWLILSVWRSVCQKLKEVITHRSFIYFKCQKMFLSSCSSFLTLLPSTEIRSLPLFFRQNTTHLKSFD